MWFGKNIMTKLGLALALAVPAFAAPVEPLQFQNITGEQQEYWNFLTKFKLWGTNGIETQRINLPDSSGWTGTAKNGFTGKNEGLILGGPIVIGGDIDFSDADKFQFTSGPVRTTGTFTGGNDNGGNLFRKAICVEGGYVNESVEKGIKRANEGSLATLHLGSTAATSGDCAYDKVAKVRTDLSVPLLTGTHSYESAVHVYGGWNNPVYIDVPAQGAGDPEVYDLYLTGISFENDSRLVVRMPEKGRLTRIFLSGALSFGTHPEILIQYVGKNATYDTGSKRYTSLGDSLKDIDIDSYFGNLMIYTHENITFSKTDNHPILGTFVSTKNISIESNMKFAGQIIANSLTIGNEIDGTGFHYMPFDPDTLKIPEALSGGKYPENDKDALVPISLDSKAKVDVSFKYCFDLSSTHHKSGVKYADANDFKKISTFKLCENGEYGTISIKEGETESDTKIYIHVKTDDELEKDEILLLKIFDLEGAVMPNTTSDNEFELIIVDASGPEFNDDVKKHDVDEHTSKGTKFATIPIKNVDIKVADSDKLELVLSGKDASAAAALFDFEVVFDARKVADVYDTAYIKMTVNTDNLDYETLAQTSFEVKLSLKYDGHLTDSTIRTINVIDINEAPKITSIEDLNQDYAGSPTPYILYPKESLKGGDSVGVVWVDDPDIKSNGKFNHQEYAIDDKTVPFTMSHDTIVVKNGSTLNYENGIDYTFNVVVTNCEWNVATNTKISGGVCHEVKQKITVKVQDVNEPPVITCKDNTDPKCKGPYEVFEHSKKDSLIYTFIVKDEDKVETFTTTITDKNGNEIKLFSAEVVKNTTTGDWELPLVVAKDIDYETMDRRYDVTITVTDKGGETFSINRTIYIVDVNESPTITGVKDLNGDIKDVDKDAYTFYPKEDLVAGGYVGYVHTTDPDVLHKDEFGFLTFSIDDQTVPFEMKDSLMVLTKKLDYETDPKVYTFDVVVVNCEREKNSAGKYVVTDKCLAPVTKTVTVKLQDVDEPPIIIPKCEGDDCPTICQGDKCEVCTDLSCHEECVENCDKPYDPVKVLTVSVNEHSPKNYEVMRYLVRDEDYGVGHTKDLTAEIKNTTANTGAADLFAAKMEKDADGNWNVVVYVADSAKLDYEKLSFYTHDVTINVYDPDDGEGVHGSLLRVIKVVDVNEAPVITGVEDLNKDYKGVKEDNTFYPEESLEAGGSVGYVHTDDPDVKHLNEFGYREFSLDNPNNYPFEMKDSLLVLTKKLNYEKDLKEFTFDVVVNNCERVKNSAGEYEKLNPPKCADPVTQTVTVKLQDVEEPPIIIPKCEGDNCPTICQGDKCEVCTDASCHEECVENCDKPYDPVKVLTVSVNEHSPKNYEIMRYLVRDEDYGVGHTKALTAEIKNTTSNTGAEDLFAAKMEKDANGDWNVVVYVADSAKLDYEKLNFYTHDVTIYVKDPGDPEGMYDSLLRVIKVVDVNEAPSAKDSDLKPNENLPKGTVIGKLDVSEPDSKHIKEFGHLEYMILKVDTATYAFKMDSNKVVVNDPSKLDYELKVHKYTFDVQIANCELNKSSGKYDGACLYDTAKVTVDVQDVNEKPEIIVDGPTPDGDDDADSLCVAVCDTTDRGVKGKDSILTVGIRENPDNPNGTKKIITPTGMILFQYHVADEDTNHATGAKVSWFDAATTIPSVNKMGSDLFTIAYDSVKHVITVRVKDEKLLDYETLRNAQSRNDPDPEYTMGIVVTDPKGLSDTLYRKIRIIDENEKPLFDVWPLVITENNKINDSLGHVEHPSDIDSMSRNPALYDNGFKMTGGDTSLFWLDKDSTDLMRVMIRANVVLDCENGQYTCGQDSMYWVYMTYGDTTLRTIYTDLKIPVKLIDLNEAPKILTDTIGVDENSPKGTVVDTIKWSDVDGFDSVMTFKIVDDPIGCFDIDSKTGVVTVKSNKCSGLDYEKNSTIDLKVSITDLVGIPDSLYDDNCKCQLISAKNGPITVTKTIKVNIHDVNEPPSITNKTIHVKEDTKPKTVVDTVRASDPDNDPKFTDLTYTLIDGDTATFKIEPKTGALILKDTLDHESKDTYSVVVRVDDGEFADTATVKIIIDDVKEWTKVKITEASSKRKTWDDPEVIYTNEPIREICWNQDGFDTCMTDLNIAKDSVVVVKWKNPTKNYAGTDTLKIYYNNSIPSVTVVGKDTTFDAENVFTIVEDMGEADSNIYVSKPKDSIYVKIKDPAIKYDTTIAIEVSLEPIDVSKVQGTLDKMTKIVDSKIMRDETAKNVTETAVNSNQFRYSYNEIIGKDTVTVSYMTDKDENPIKVPVVNAKGKVDSVEVITVTYKTVIEGKLVEVSYQADALTGEVFVKGPSGELMEQGASKTLYASSKSDKDSTNKSTKTTYDVNEGMFTITTGGKDALGNDRVISYSVNKKGKMVKNSEGDAGFSVTYSYMNKYGNIATESVFIVVDQVAPKVEILSPVDREVVRSNSVNVVWTVDGIKQDTLTLQGLSKGPNVIVRYYRDKAGNEDSAVVYVFMKDSKDVEIAVEQPVTEISKDKIDEYYAVNPPKKGETFAVSIKNPTTGEEVETLIGGKFKTKEGSGKEPYPGVSGSKHLGPTLALDIKVPVIDGVAGLATLDDLITPDGLIALERTDAKKAHKITVNQYVEEYCEDDFEIPSDVSQVNLFDTKLKAQIWVYTSLGNFVDYFSFTQELNDPSYTDDAGLLKMYFEMKPDKDGFVKADNGKQYATGAFVYKVQATIRSKARCTIPDNTYNPEVNKGDGFGETTKRKGDVIKNSDELLKSFGYRRPQHK